MKARKGNVKNSRQVRLVSNNLAGPNWINPLPPIENIRKRADEVYGEAEIPERKPGN